jgi:biotin carboxyl carrier protein
MKNYIITVNGVSYEVSVEETGATSAPAAAPVKAAAPVAPKAAAPAAAPAAPKAAAPAAAGAGSIKVAAGAAGKIFKIEVSVGASVKKGDAVIILEAMKMEIPVVAPEDGTVASIDCAVGDMVEAGATLATLN